MVGSFEGALSGPSRVSLGQVAQRLASERLAGTPPLILAQLRASSLPVPVDGMFITNEELLLDFRNANGADYRLLGLSDSIGGSPYLLSAVGSVVLHDAEDNHLRFVNSSLDAFLFFVKRWDSFVSLDAVDEDAGMRLGRKLKKELRKLDGSAFVDEDSWWACIFEEVEYGILGPA